MLEIAAAANFGARGGLLARRGWLGASVGVLIFPGRRSIDGAGPGAEVALVAGEARTCGSTSPSWVGLSVCAGAELGQMTAVGTRLLGPRTDRSSWAAAVGGPSMTVARAR